MSLHRCTEPECCYTDQPSPKECGCHKTDEQVLLEQRGELLAALEAILSAETYALHVGYDERQNYIYADAVRLDDEAFTNARLAIARALTK